MKSQIEDLERENKNFRCFFSIDKSIKEGWTGLTGFIDEEKLKKTLPENKSNSLFAVCGPPILCNIIEKLLTTKFNVNPNQIFRF
jgi:Na+-transporting NADH:ubiquinone oxidoreductase subunit NqrF